LTSARAVSLGGTNRAVPQLTMAAMGGSARECAARRAVCAEPASAPNVLAACGGGGSGGRAGGVDASRRQLRATRSSVVSVRASAAKPARHLPAYAASDSTRTPFTLNAHGAAAQATRTRPTAFRRDMELVCDRVLGSTGVSTARQLSTAALCRRARPSRTDELSMAARTLLAAAAPHWPHMH
jgi:hypothetical protein